MSNRRNNEDVALGFQSSLQQTQVDCRLAAYLPWQKSQMWCGVNLCTSGSRLSQSSQEESLFRLAILYMVRRKKPHPKNKWLRKISITESTQLLAQMGKTLLSNMAKYLTTLYSYQPCNCSFSCRSLPTVLIHVPWCQVHRQNMKTVQLL